jgi:ring-1,2-phenylacetyl-CoA epoxidase subunit PaaE
MSEVPRVSRPTAIDVLAAAVARVTPRALHPRIDAVRLDLRQMVRSLTVEKTHPFSSSSEPFEAPPSLDEISVLDALLPKPLAERVDAVRRDVRAMTRPARGEKTPVVVPIRAQPAAAVVPIVAAPAAAEIPVADEPSRAVHPRTVRVLEARRETADATTFVLEDPSGAALSFHPGQFVTVIVTVEGEQHRRAYSISSALSELPRFAITVKRVRGGVVSNHLNDRVREGDTLEILGPSGAFCLGETSADRLYLFAGGSGITPVYAILRDVLANDDRARVTLVYANRSKDAVIFREAIDELVRANPERLALLSVLEQSDEYAQLTGRLDAENCAAVCEVLEVPTDARCFLCGPEPMMDAVRATLLARGVDRANIHEERFSSPQRRTHESPASRGGHSLEIRYGKSSKKLTTRPDQTILEAGLEAGIDMPFSCTMGGCGACKLSLVSGTVDVVEPNCLLESEREAGAILACVGCTTSDVVVEVPE